MSNQRIPFALAVALASASFSAAGHAADPYALCPPFGPELPELPTLAPDAPARAEADRARHDGRVADMQGDVRLQRGDQRLLAEHIRYTLAPEKIEVDGDLRFWDSQRILFAQRAAFWPGEDRGELEAVRFWLPPNHLSGESAKVTRLNARQDRLDAVSLSSCPTSKRDWVLEAARMDLDHDRGRGVAHDTWLSFKGVPLFYSPWLDFPLDDRRASGFLYPSLGFSSPRGVELGMPYYWNIAPDRDATLTFRPMSQRGLMLQGEYRQLWRAGQAQANLDWLPHDEDSGQQNRYLVNTRADGQVADWNGSLALRRASDRDFMRDFSLTPWGSTTDYLESHASARRDYGHWNLLLNAQQWQTLTYNVTEAARPYRRLPQVRLTGHEALGPLELTLDTEAVRFAHEFAPNPEGERYAIQPALSLPIQEGWYSITPRVALDSTHDQLDTGSFERTTPITSLDTRLFFDRYGDTLHQQLEPRLYYLYVPYRKQDGPLFDSGLASPSLSRLFTPNRFVGRDRLGDAHALSYALTWRALDALEGFERASVALGQRYRFSDERVTLNPGDPSNSSGAGEVMGEIGIGLSRAWRLRLTAATDANIDKLTQTYALLGYRGQGGHLFNLHYAQHKDDPGLPDLEQAGLSFAWPVSRQWRLLGSVVEDLKGEAVIQALAGVEYDSCCWRLRMGARRYVVDSPDIDVIETDTAVLIQLELKGLGGLGQQADRQFERDILGFSSLQAD
ncbi:MAG: LPS-assembly protein LptD [Halothiobacillaceae bacterium]|nr:MAG: LPS-assembly protein LptD [Halothiobacillaceae bacterium]